MINKDQVYAELDRVYAEYKEDGWCEQDGTPAKGISLESINQAKEFLIYLDLDSVPYVVPYDDGYVGFEWHEKDVFASVNFRTSEKFSYAILTPSEKYYDSVERNYLNQKKVACMLSIALENVE